MYRHDSWLDNLTAVIIANQLIALVPLKRLTSFLLPILQLQGILESLPQVTNVSKIQSTSHVYAIRANSEIDEGVLRRLQSMATTVLLARKAGTTTL